MTNASRNLQHLPFVTVLILVNYQMNFGHKRWILQQLQQCLSAKYMVVIDSRFLDKLKRQFLGMLVDLLPFATLFREGKYDEGKIILL